MSENKIITLSNGLQLFENDLNDYELKEKKISYGHYLKRLGVEFLLCNNVQYDDSIYDNFSENYYLYDDNGDYECPDIFQWCLCNLNNWQREKLLEADFILTYSDSLDLDIICVDHFGTNWFYVLTNIEIMEA